MNALEEAALPDDQVKKLDSEGLGIAISTLEEALATKMRAVWPAAAVAKIAEEGLKQLDSLCYECGDDAKENDGLQQVVRSALADVD